MVAVTGGTGFVGSHTVKALIESGHEVRLLSRSGGASPGGLASLGVEIPPERVIRGDVCDSRSVERLLDGCDAVVHMAGIVGVDERRADEMWRVNVDATSHLLSAAVTRGLDPIVHVASYSALFPTTDRVMGPDSPTAVGRSSYGLTKGSADRVARVLQATGAPIVITYPSSVIGPAAGNARGATAEGWAPLLRFKRSVTFDGGIAMIDVRDLAAIHAAAMSPGQGPKRYMCGGTMVPFDTILDYLAAAIGQPIKRIHVSKRALMAIGRLADVASKVLPFPPSFSYEAAWIMTSATSTDDSRTLSELGITYRPVAESLAESVR